MRDVLLFGSQNPFLFRHRHRQMILKFKRSLLKNFLWKLMQYFKCLNELSLSLYKKASLSKLAVISKFWSEISFIYQLQKECVAVLEKHFIPFFVWKMRSQKTPSSTPCVFSRSYLRNHSSSTPLALCQKG